MTKIEQKRLIILKSAYDKLKKSAKLLIHSVQKIQPYDKNKSYTEDELEPYDAMTGRFERTVEVSINKFFRAVEFYEFEIISDTIRDRLNNMHKLNLITNTELWLDMRDIRNRIAHDYLPHQIKEIYDDITIYTKEIQKLLDNISIYFNKRGINEIE